MAFLEISQNSQENTCAIEKDTLAQVFSCEICEIFKSSCFKEHLRTTTPKHDESINIQRQPPEVFFKNSALKNFLNIRRCFPVKLAKFLRTRILKRAAKGCF